MKDETVIKSEKEKASWQYYIKKILIRGDSFLLYRDRPEAKKKKAHHNMLLQERKKEVSKE